MQEKILKAQFDFSDFLKQMRLMKNMGSLGGLLNMIPGMGKLSGEQLQKGESELKKAEAIINSMTKQERQNPDLLTGSPNRRSRIAKGSGHKDHEVTELVGKFMQMRSLMQKMGQGEMPDMLGGMMGGGNRPAQPGWRGYTGAPGKTKKKKDKKKKGFGTL
jgi:signal recognition particle subunit SRP54